MFRVQDLDLFNRWLKEAELSEPNDANAMSLATVDDSGMPNIRIVLLKGADQRGFVFYTNLSSAKGRELLSNGKATLCFNWKSLNRQVIVRGNVELVSDAEADEYFNSRPRQSRLGAWASRQSAPLESRAMLLKEVAKYALKFGVGSIPRPDHWSGFRLFPTEIKFQQNNERELI